MSHLAVPAKHAVQVSFPELTISYGEPPNAIVTVEPLHDAFGAIEILDDEFELTVNCGRFTHVHISNYDDGISSEERTGRIVADLIEFLTNVFTDRLEFWGTHGGGGGCRLRDPQSPLARLVGSEQAFTWSRNGGRTG